MIEFDGVSRALEVAPGREQLALREVSMHIGDGEYVAVMGCNGSGKTTLVRHINALLLPSSGHVRVGGMDTSAPERLWEIRQRVGVVFQNPDYQMVATTVEEEVAFGPENLGFPPDEIAARVNDALAEVGMLAWRQHNPAYLSGGQKQRVAIAAVLAMCPRVLVLDEPTAMLDAAGRHDVLAILRRLNRNNGMTVVLVTHSMEEAAQASRLVVLAEGRVAVDGPFGEIASDITTLRRLGLTPPAVVRAVAPLIEAGLRLPRPLPLDASLVARAIAEWTRGGDVQNVPIASAPRACPRTANDGIDVSLRNVCFTYMEGTPFETAALCDISLDLSHGERVAVMGGTGSGKTTLSQHLNGLLRATAGTVRVGPHVLSDARADVRAVRRKVGLVFQFPEHQLFEETVAQDIAFGPKNLGFDKSEVEARARQAMALVGLPFDEFALRNPHALSGGEMRRVALAGVLATDPSLLVMDEPAAGLDAPGQLLLVEAVLAVQDRGVATLVVSHDIELVVDLADRLLRLDSGRLTFDGTVSAGCAGGPPAAETLPAASAVARALIAEGVHVDPTVVRAEALAQEVIRAVMNQRAG